MPFQALGGLSKSTQLLWEKVKNASLQNLLSELRELFIVATFIIHYYKLEAVMSYKMFIISGEEKSFISRKVVVMLD